MPIRYMENLNAFSIDYLDNIPKGEDTNYSNRSTLINSILAT